MKATGRPIASAMALAISACVTAAGPHDRVGLPFVPRFGQCASGHGSNVADVNRADPRVSDWRDEVSLRCDHRLERQETLEVQIGTEERESDAKLADASFDGRVVAKKTYR
jgi:hypothetical protein